MLALEPGKVEKLPDFKEISIKYQVDIYHHLQEGSIIREYHNNLNGCGYVVAISNAIEDAERRAEESKNLVDKSIVREEFYQLRESLEEVAASNES